MGIHAFWGPPQSGKTSLAVDMAFAISRQNKSVCLISPEPYSELSARLNIKIVPERSLNAASKKAESMKQIVYTVDDLLFALAVPYDNDAFGEELSENAAKAILTQANSLYDYVFVDCPSHTGSVLSALALSLAENVILMSGSHSASVLWYNSFARAVDEVKPRTVRVCTEVNDNFDYCTLHSLLDTTPDFWLPHFPDAASTQMLRRTLYQHSGRRGKEYTKVIDAICTQISGKEVEEE